ncbi:MAG TPA: sigma-54-dependent Fis family transcriptional regulator, partial [Caldithrix sp.]|nr:sigma-54-dependent Fis family transcriptional regulator [Caldithrix sp.]
MKPRILIVDDYIQHAENLKEILLVNNYRSDAVYSAEEASELLKTKAFDLILLDNKLPGMDGLDFVREMRKEENDTPVIMYSAFGDSHLGSEAAKLGVYDFLPKGEDLNHLYDVIEETIQKYKLLTQQKFDAQYFKQKYNFVGVSPAIKKIFETIENIASTDAKILIIGETGSGKNLLAEAIHQISDRASKPYVWLDCNTIPENLLESELFGHERGAFTGAHRKRIGKLSVADKGTLFLDQIDDLSPQLQAKFLRLIETGKFEAVGSNLKQEIDIRVIA